MTAKCILILGIESSFVEVAREACQEIFTAISLALPILGHKEVEIDCPAYAREIFSQFTEFTSSSLVKGDDEYYDGDKLLELIETSSWQRWAPHYFLAVMDKPILTKDGWVANWQTERAGSILTPSYLQTDLKPSDVREAFKTLTMHSLGHVFGQMPRSRLHALGPDCRHCGNRCSMAAIESDSNICSVVTKQRLAIGKPYCRDCIADLTVFWKQHHSHDANPQY